MKKTVIAGMVLLATLVSCKNGQNKQQNETAAETPAEVQMNKGRVVVNAFDGFKLHSYYNNDAIGDMSYIVEGKDGLVTMEEPLFKDNIAEFNEYLGNLGKPVVKRINSYHIGEVAGEDVVMPEGMAEFSKGPIYGGMMAGFAESFGDAIAALPDVDKNSSVAFGSTQKWADVDFLFQHGATSDFPGASILIGKDVYYTHWSPSKSHVSALQIGSLAAVDAEIAESENALKSGAQLFIGGHGPVATKADLEFHIEYLKKIKALASENKDAESFEAALKTAYPGLAGEENVTELANALYK